MQAGAYMGSAGQMQASEMVELAGADDIEVQVGVWYRREKCDLGIGINRNSMYPWVLMQVGSSVHGRGSVASAGASNPMAS